MTRGEMIEFVNDQTEKTDRENAIRLLAYFLEHDDPVNPELYFQQMVGGE